MTSFTVLEGIDSTLPEDFQEKYDAFVEELKTLLSDQPERLRDLQGLLYMGFYTLFGIELANVVANSAVGTSGLEDIVLEVTKKAACVGIVDEAVIAQRVEERFEAKQATNQALSAFNVRWTEFVEVNGGERKLGYLAKNDRFYTRV